MFVMATVVSRDAKKTVFRVPEKVWRKPACAPTEDG